MSREISCLHLNLQAGAVIDAITPLKWHLCPPPGQIGRNNFIAAYCLQFSRTIKTRI